MRDLVLVVDFVALILSRNPEKPEVQDSGGHSEVKVQVRDLEMWILLQPLPHGGQFSGKSRFIEPKGINGHRRPVPGALSSGTPWETRQSKKISNDQELIQSDPTS